MAHQQQQQCEYEHEYDVLCRCVLVCQALLLCNVYYNTCFRYVVRLGTMSTELYSPPPPHHHTIVRRPSSIIHQSFLRFGVSQFFVAFGVSRFKFDFQQGEKILPYHYNNATARACCLRSVLAARAPSDGNRHKEFELFLQLLAPLPA